MLYPYLVWTELFPLTKKAFGLHQQFPILETHNTLSRAGLCKLQHFCQQRKALRRISAL